MGFHGVLDDRMVLEEATASVIGSQMEWRCIFLESTPTQNSFNNGLRIEDM